MPSPMLAYYYSSAARFLKHKTASQGCHNLLSLDGKWGGKFHLDDADWDKLYEHLAEDQRESRPNFLVQSRSSIWPFTLDLDFHSQDRGMDWVREEVVPLICRGVRRALAVNATYFTLILTSATSKELSFCPAGLSEKVQGTKTGLHIHFTSYSVGEQVAKLSVNTDTALLLRRSILVELYQILGQPQGQNSWHEVVDESVLTSNGVRMLFQWKASKCDDCRAAIRQLEKEHGACQQGSTHPYWNCNCPRCLAIKVNMSAAREQHGCSFGRKLDQRHYTPLVKCLYSCSEDSLTVLKDYSCGVYNAQALLKATAVRFSARRMDKGSCGLTPVIQVATPPDMQDTLSDAKTAGAKRRRPGPAKLMPGGSHSTPALAKTDHRHKLISQLLEREEVQASYPGCAMLLRGVRQISPDCLSASMDKGYCQNAGRQHANNNTYFLIKPGQILQKCHDEECRHYSNSITVNTPDALFG